MENGLGAMQMSPADFWAQTPREWDARLAGHRKANGADNSDNLTKSELDAMIDADERGEIHEYGGGEDLAPAPLH